MAEEEKSGKTEDNKNSNEKNSAQSDDSGKSNGDEGTQSDEKSSNGSGGGKDGKKKGEQITIYEWIIAALGCTLVFSSLVFMTYKAVTATGKPPDLIVTVQEIEEVKTGYLVKFKVKNNGEYAAAVAVIKGELKKGDKTEETSTTTVDYVPSYSTRSGGVFFTKNPKDFKVDLRATGYTEP